MEKEEKKELYLFPYKDNSGKIFQIGKIPLQELLKTIKENLPEDLNSENLKNNDIIFLEELYKTCEEYLNLPHEQKCWIPVSYAVIYASNTRLIDFCIAGVERTKKVLENTLKNYK